jgi:hypothetical protein
LPTNGAQVCAGEIKSPAALDGLSGDFDIAQYYHAHWGAALASVMVITRLDR